VIGEDWWTGEGFTAKRTAAALRGIGPNPVTVQINSPGGTCSRGWRSTTSSASTQPR